MKQDNVNYLMVGGFVVAIGIVFITLIVVLSGRLSNGDTYYAVFDNVTAITEGSAVTYNGYPIGQVASIEPTFSNTNKTQFKVAMMVQSGWKIASDSTVAVATKGLLSDAQLSITEGSLTNLLPVGGNIKSAVANDVMQSMQNLAQQVNHLSSELIVPLVSQLKDDVGLFTGHMNSELPKLTTNLNVLVSKLAKNSETIDEFFSDENKTSVNALLKSTELMMRDLKQSSSAVNDIVTKNKPAVNASIKTANQSVEFLNTKLESILIQMEQTSRHLNDFSQQIKSNPGVIIRSKSQTDPAIR